MTAYVIGTADTKREELLYVRDMIVQAGIETKLVDIGIRSDGRDADFAPAAIAAFHPDGAACILGQTDRGQAIAAMAEAFRRFMQNRSDVTGVIGMGGGGGTSLIAPGLREIPLGIPKILVSTIASGNVAPYIGASDIIMMYSVTDIAGLNRISRRILGNAAHALVGMIERPVPPVRDDRPTIGLTMFGVTTPCVNQVTALLRDSFDCIVFHATGVGGMTLERLAESGFLGGIVDLTTTEVADLLVGGICACTDRRLDAVARTRLPYVGSCGALDMVNFGAPETVPAAFQGRRLHAHNPNATLMRTTREENRRIGAWIGTKLNQCDGPVRFLIPEGGVSAMDAPGQPFFDTEADAALFETLEQIVRATSARRIVRVPHHINAPEFARAVTEHFAEICRD